MWLNAKNEEIFIVNIFQVFTVLRTYKERTYKGQFTFFKKIYCVRIRDKFLKKIIFNQKIWSTFFVPVGEQGPKIKPLDGRFFSNLVAVKIELLLSALYDLSLSKPKTLIKKR